MSDSIPALARLVSIVPPPPKVPVEPTEAEIEAHYARIAARQAELDEIEAHMAKVHEARTVRPAKRKAS